MIGRLIKYKGKYWQVGQLAKRFNLLPVTLAKRIYQYKWPLERCLTTLPKPQHKAINYDDAVELYQHTMRRFLTKKQRLESYKRLITEMKEQRLQKAA